MKSSIIKSINSLPSLSKTIRDINRIYADKEAGIMDLVKVIENDPMIVANILKFANSPLYNFGKEIKDVTQVVSRFGMNITRSIVLGHSMRNLLNIDMKPYCVTSVKFTEISTLQATLIINWYKHIDKKKAEDLYLAAFLQEIGKIILASYIIEENEDISFASEIETTNNIPEVEKIYTDTTSAIISAKIFSHWGFDTEFTKMIEFSDNPKEATQDIKEYAIALNIVKTIIPINSALTEQSINFGIRKAKDAGYDCKVLEDEIKIILEKI